MGGAPLDDQPAQALEAFGAPADVIARVREQLRQQSGEQRFCAWPENWCAVQLFAAMQTQWRWCSSFSGMHRTGLDYSAMPAVRACLEWHESAIPPSEQKLFLQLRAIEYSALAAMREQ